MRFSFHALALLALSAVAVGCSTAEALTAPDPTPVPPDKTDGQSLYFEDQGTLTLQPGEVRAIRVKGTGKGPFRVGFSLLGNDVGDAFVEAGVVDANGKGVATGILHAPNQATTFKLRAAVVDDDGQPGAGAELSVAVSDAGFGSLRILPQYTGKRAVEAWTASVVARTTCADLASVLPGEPEGSLVAVSTANAAPLVENAPVGPNLAVTIRTGHYAWGCADVSTLAASSTLDVKVQVLDKPVVLTATNLDLTLELKPDPEAFAKLIGDASYLLRQGFAPVELSDAQLVLGAMAAVVPAAEAPDFAKQRLLGDWDAATEAHFAALDVSLRDRIDAWALGGLPLPSPTLTGNLRAKPGDEGLATLTVLSVGGITADAAGVPVESSFAWTADPSDALILKGLLLWQPSRFAGALAKKGALSEAPGASTVPEALAQIADCQGLASELGGFGSCDAGCLAALCASALEARWAEGLSASSDAGLLGHITITAAGPAILDDLAQPIGFDGVWVGSIGDNQTMVETKGSVVGAPPNMAPPP